MTSTGSFAAPPSPKKSRPLLWMGCGALPVLLIGGLVLGAYAFLRFVRSRYVATTSATPGAAKAELRYFRPHAETAGWITPQPCFFGALVNTGSVPVRRARLQLTFFDSMGARVGAESWSSSRTVLKPGEMEPVAMCPLFGPQGTRYSESLTVETSTFQGQVYPLEISDAATRVMRHTAGTPGPRNYEVKGVAHNKNAVAVKGAEVVVTLFNAANEVIGGQVTYLAGGSHLAVGESARFETMLYVPIEKARVEVHAVGYVGR